jgi:hypothetical protein
MNHAGNRINIRRVTYVTEHSRGFGSDEERRVTQQRPNCIRLFSAPNRVDQPQTRNNQLWVFGTEGDRCDRRTFQIAQ